MGLCGPLLSVVLLQLVIADQAVDPSRVVVLSNGALPASAGVAEAYLKDKKSVLPAAAWIDGEYGQSGMYLGVPTVIGAGGIERVIEVPLSADEKAALDVSAGKVAGLVAALAL